LNYFLLQSYIGKSKELALKMVKSKTIKLHGFPHHVTVPDVKTFVEQYTGEESVVAIKIRKCSCYKNKCCCYKKKRFVQIRTAFAIIQFTTTDHATYMMALCSGKKLQFWKSYLKVTKMERDIDPKPTAFFYRLDDVKLYFGCQISKERFSVLWGKMDASADFGIGLRKWRFSMCHDDKKFKLELSYENIWKIELHQPWFKTAKYLLIQVVKFNFSLF
jgi:RNA-dependent RNA polymerase